MKQAQERWEVLVGQEATAALFRPEVGWWERPNNSPQNRQREYCPHARDWQRQVYLPRGVILEEEEANRASRSLWQKMGKGFWPWCCTERQPPLWEDTACVFIWKAFYQKWSFEDEKQYDILPFLLTHTHTLSYTHTVFRTHILSFTRARAHARTHRHTLNIPH